MPGFEIGTILGHQVRVEASVEIIAKKLWHRGDRITGRDIFGFALIAEREPEVLMQAREFMTRHAAAVFLQLEERSVQLKQQFEAVYVLNFHPTFNALRDDLAALFSNTRTLARSVQEFRAPQSDETEKFGIDQTKITAVRHGAAETYHRIRLRLNAGQDDHKELLRLLNAMMGAQQAYIVNKEGDVAEPIGAVETAASHAEGVLKTEWETVKFGERAYRDSFALPNTHW